MRIQKAARLRRLSAYLLLCVLLALLVDNTAGSLAGGLAGSLALTAAAGLGALAQVAGLDRLDSFHENISIFQDNMPSDTQ